MKNRRNYYRILHVQPDAPRPIVKSAYRALMLDLELHPDRGGEHWNAALLNEAYEIVSDPVRRQRYDRDRQLWRRETSAAAAGGRPAPGDGVETTTPADCENAMAPCPFCCTPLPADVLPEPPARCTGCGGPVAMPRPGNLEGSGKRGVRRRVQDHAMRFYVDWPRSAEHRGRIRDLSPSGLRFDCSESLRPYRILRIESDVVDAIARVAHCKKVALEDATVFSVGVEFFTLEFRRPEGVFLSTSG